MQKVINRRKLGYKTATIALVVAVIEGLLTLLRTKAVLYTFGDSKNAIMQVAVQITSYLVLFESGMTAAYQLRLYKPISEKNIDKISTLYLGLSKNMKSIVAKMLISINIISFVYIFFFLNTQDSRIYAFFVFFVMGLRFVSPYLLTLTERTVLYASEKGYIVNIIQGILQCGTLATEVVLCYLTNFPLPVILSSYLIGVLIAKVIYIIYRRKVLKININVKSEPDMEPTNMTKDILVHQVSGMITSNTDNILLSIMSKLTNVTIYSSFNTVVNFPVTLFNSIIGSMKASVIIKIQKGDKNAFLLYENVLKLSCYVMAIVTSVFFVQINRFVELWIGNRYTLGLADTAMFSFILFNQVVLNVLTIGIDAVGLYKETKIYAVAQAILNFTLTLILIPPMGITGALLGTVVSFIVVKIPFMSRSVYKKVFNKKNNSYRILGSGIMITLIDAGIDFYFSSFWKINSWMTFIVSSLICLICAFLITTVWYLITDKNMVNYFFRNSLRKE